MAYLMNDELDRRIRAALPPVEAAEPDVALLARVTARPREAVRRRRRAAPAAALVAAALAAFLFLAVRGPEQATAIEQALRWFDPPAGTVLHTRAVGTLGEREVWVSADDPSRMRVVERRDGVTVAFGVREVYDGARDTIYMATGEGKAVAGVAKPGQHDSGAAKRPGDEPRVTKRDATAAGKASLPLAAGGDPVVSKVRALLAEGDAVVRGRERHDGADAWAITLRPGADRPAWTLWVSAEDGRPLAMHDPGDPARGKPGGDTRWTAYEVLGPEALQSVREAHPGARVVRDDAAYLAALERLGH